MAVRKLKDSPKSTRSGLSNKKNTVLKASNSQHVEKHKSGRVNIADTINSISKKDLLHWLSNESVNVQPILSDFDIIEMASKGISKGSLDALAQRMGISRKTMAETILDVSVKTLERKPATAKMDKKSSSHALEIAKIMRQAFEVFENEEKVRNWINRENRSLNGKKPLELFDTLTGLNMVSDILTRIEEGVYS